MPNGLYSRSRNISGFIEGQYSRFAPNKFRIKKFYIHESCLKSQISLEMMVLVKTPEILSAYIQVFIDLPCV